MEIFVTHYDWNEQFNSVEEMAEGCSEGSEFSLVRLTVGGFTRYKIINGAPVAMSVSFPERLAEADRLIEEEIWASLAAARAEVDRLLNEGGE